MKVSWRHSLSTKLFILMSVCLLASISGMSLYHNNKFKDYLDRTIEEATVQRAKDVANTVEGMLDYWSSLTSIAMHTLSTAPKQGMANFLSSFVSSSTEIVSFEVMRADGFSIASAFTDQADSRFEDNRVSDIETTLHSFAKTWITQLEQNEHHDTVYLTNLTPATGLPIMALAMRYHEEASSQTLWAFLTVWQTRLLKALPNTGSIRGVIVNTMGQPVFSPSLVQGRNPHSEALDPSVIAMLSTEQAPLGFRHYQASDGAPMLGSFARMDRYGMVTIVNQDARPALSVIDNIISKTLLWSWVYVLAFVMVSYIASSRVTSRLTALFEATRRIAGGDFSVAVAYRGRDEVAGLSQSVQDMAGQIQTLLRDKVTAARQEKELETARLVQETFLPSRDFDSEFLHITGISRPASECGGDWWGHFVIEDRYHYLVIADATGHGVGAALVTAMAFSGYQTIFECLQKSASIDSSPSQMLKLLHSVLLAAGSGETSMTCFVAKIDQLTGKMEFASGGHNFPVLIPKTSKGERNHNIESVSKKSWDERYIGLRNFSNPLGITSEGAFSDNFIDLMPGDRIVLYTDGIIENRNQDGRPWGLKKFRTSILAHADQPLQRSKELILADASQHFESTPGDDDMTVVIAEVDLLWTAQSLKAAS